MMGRFWKFGAEEWKSVLGVDIPSEDVASTGDFPDANEARILESDCPVVRGRKVRETSFAFLGLSAINGEPLTIAKLHTMFPPTGQPHLYLCEPPTHEFGKPVRVDKPWYIRGNYAFACKDVCELRWYLCPLHPVLTSRFSTLEEQLRSIPAEYEWTPAIVEVLKRYLFFLLSGIRIRHTVTVKGPGPVSPDVSIGAVLSEGLHIFDGFRSGSIAINRVTSQGDSYRQETRAERELSGSRSILLPV